MAYCLREKRIKNYKNLANGLRLPRWRRLKAEPKLYSIEILEEDQQNRRVKVHYVSYGDEDDEWIKEEDTVDLEPTPQEVVMLLRQPSNMPLFPGFFSLQVQAVRSTITLNWPIK